MPAYTQPFSDCHEPNSVWSADFKGHFRLGRGAYCYPLTVSDNCSRFLLMCRGLKHPNALGTRRGFEEVFEEYGLPDVIRTDNGQPFAGLGIGGLTPLSLWWIKLGIIPERIELGHPEQNGRHERMHRTLKESTAVNPEETFEKQQHRFDHFKEEYNGERPHQALKGKRPKDVYQKSLREMPNTLPELNYPEGMELRKVRTNGEIKWAGKRIYISELLHGEPVGLEAIDERRAFLYLGKIKLGIVDARKNRVIRP